MAKSAVNIGIIGTGGISNVHADACAHNPRARVVALADVNVDTARGFAERHRLDVPVFGDFAELIALDAVDAVIIGTSNDAHMPIAIAAAQARKHILCEKPLAVDVDSAVEMVEAAKRARVRAMVGYSKRFFDQIRFLKHFLTTEDLGRIFHVRAFYLQSWLCDPTAPRYWRLERSKTGSGVLGDLGSHITDLAQFLVGDIVRVQGLLRTFTSKRPAPGNPSKMLPVDVDDAVVFGAEFACGALGQFEASRNATGHGDHWAIEVNAEKGAVRFDKDQGRVQLLLREGPARHAGWVDLSVPHAFHTSSNEFHTEVSHFVDCILNRKKPEPDFAEGLKVERVLEGVIKSSATGTAVVVGR